MQHTEAPVFGVCARAVAVETLNLERASHEELEAALDRCAGFVLGSPTLRGHMPTQVRFRAGARLVRFACRHPVPHCCR